jgi:hypothetical protein
VAAALIKKVKTVYLLFFSSWLLLAAHATSLKSPQTVSFSNVRSLLEIYKAKHENSLPSNWQDFIDSGILSGDALNNSRRFLDIENRYIFVDVKPIQFGNRTERVLIMARQAGGEGDNNNAEEPEKRKGRWLIVEASDGSIQTRKYPEVMLKSYFEKAGLSLADFTSAAPPPPEFAKHPKEPNSEGVALGGPEDPSEGTPRDANKAPKRERKPRSPHSGNGIDSIKSSSWGIWIASGIATIGIFALAWIVRRLFLSKSLPKNDDHSI